MVGIASHQDELFIRQALDIARVADSEGDMGVASLIVKDGKVVGQGRNRIHTSGNPLAHAETEAIASACQALGRDDLAGCTLYTTMEPCPMCAGALLLASVDRWVIGGRFKSVGRTDLGQYSVETFATFVAAEIEITAGVFQHECETLRGRFFLRQANS